MIQYSTQKENKENQVRFSHTISNLHPQFEMNEMEEYFHKEILKRQADENPFSFIRRTDTDATIFRINHLRLELDEAKKVRDFLLINIQKGHHQFIIDLANCEFMDSTFLGAIIQVAKKLIKINGQIVLVAEPDKLKILFALRELEKILKVTTSIEEAVEELEIKNL